MRMRKLGTAHAHHALLLFKKTTTLGRVISGPKSQEAPSTTPSRSHSGLTTTTWANLRLSIMICVFAGKPFTGVLN